MPFKTHQVVWCFYLPWLGGVLGISSDEGPTAGVGGALLGVAGVRTAAPEGVRVTVPEGVVAGTPPDGAEKLHGHNEKRPMKSQTVTLEKRFRNYKEYSGVHVNTFLSKRAAFNRRFWLQEMKHIL